MRHTQSLRSPAAEASAADGPAHGSDAPDGMDRTPPPLPKLEGPTAPGWRERCGGWVRAAAWQALGFALSVLGGWVAHRAGMPLPWLLGALAVTAVLAAFGRTVNVVALRSYALVLLGLGLGQSFSPTILLSIAQALPLIAGSSVLTIVTGLAAARIYIRMVGLDPKTAFFCGVPGGVVLMAIHAQRAGVSESHVTLAQTIRLMMVVVIYPLLIATVLPHELAADGWSETATATSLPILVMWCLAGLGAAHVGRTLGLPNPWMLAPCVLAIALASSGSLPAHLPPLLIIMAQVVLGASLGARMTPDFIRSAGPLLLASVLSTLLLCALLLSLGALVSLWGGLPMTATLLGMAPGGMPEMAVTAHDMGASVPLVLGFHLVRVVLSNLLMEPIWRAARALRLI
ncbi:AbrB family transcriptional regulator [Azospirillum himalayense]|uniref:AbrB family transcriptional regulator n=1 Tax=Azospirillum himalayense TaxID=654847 RepID=A0ABW0GAX7_9PROT